MRNQKPQAYSSALELGAYAAPRSGGLWAELRDEISRNATEAGGTASLGEGPFGVELRRLIPVTTPDGEEGYQPSRMWVAEGPRWLLRGIVYGQAAIEDDADSPVVADVLAAFRQVIVRRGDEAMAPGDLLPLTMPTNAESVSLRSLDAEAVDCELASGHTIIDHGGMLGGAEVTRDGQRKHAAASTASVHIIECRARVRGVATQGP